MCDLITRDILCNMHESVADYVAEHPKMAGVLFTALLLLTQAAPASAGALASTAGP